MLTAEDSFSRYCWAYLIPDKEAHTVAKVLMDHHFNVYGLLDQLHSDNGREFVNEFWKSCFLSLRSSTLVLRHINRHKLRFFWAGPYRVIKIIAPALAEIKSVYYPGEEKLVSLDMLKLYWGEDIVRQNLEDLDLDQ